MRVLGSIPNLAGKAFEFVDHTIERQANRESYVGCDLTPHLEIQRQDLMSLRYYHPLENSFIRLDGESIPVSEDHHRIPVLLVPPLGVAAWIFDLLQDRSLVRCLLSQGLTVYLIDWGKPTKKESHLTLEKYVLDWLPAAVQAVIEHSGANSVSLMGYCFGGLMSLMQAAHQPETIKNIITIASPVDFRKMGLTSQLPNMLGGRDGKLSKFAKRSIDAINPNYLHVSGALVAKGFVLTNPVSCFSSYLKMLTNHADKNYVTAYTTKRMWFSDMLDFPGATAKELLTHLWLDNDIANGVLRLDTTELHFANIRSNLLAFASTEDKIVTRRAAKKIMSITESQDKTFHEVTGGHAGVFSGSSAAKQVWLPSACWLKSRSE